MKMKKVMTILLAAAMSLSLLSGCGGSKAEQTAPGSEAISVESEAEAQGSETPESGAETAEGMQESEAPEAEGDMSESEAPGSEGDMSESEAPEPEGDMSESEAPESEPEDMVESGEEPETDMSSDTEGNTEETTDYGYSNLNSFEAQTLDGGFFTQQDLADVDLTIINIWQTSCGPCIDEMPDLAELEKSLPENVQLLTWCLDAGWYPDAARQILDEAGFEGITLVSGNEDLETLFNELMYTPTTIFVDSKGNQVCEALIGSGDDTIARYTEQINIILADMGKEGI